MRIPLTLIQSKMAKECLGRKKKSEAKCMEKTSISGLGVNINIVNSTLQTVEIGFEPICYQQSPMDRDILILLYPHHPIRSIPHSTQLLLDLVNTQRIFFNAYGAKSKKCAINKSAAKALLIYQRICTESYQSPQSLHKIVPLHSLSTLVATSKFMRQLLAETSYNLLSVNFLDDPVPIRKVKTRVR